MHARAPSAALTSRNRSSALTLRTTHTHPPRHSPLRHRRLPQIPCTAPARTARPDAITPDTRTGRAKHENCHSNSRPCSDTQTARRENMKIAIRTPDRVRIAGHADRPPPNMKIAIRTLARSGSPDTPTGRYENMKTTKQTPRQIRIARNVSGGGNNSDSR